MDSPHFCSVDMKCTHINNWLKAFLKDIFCGVRDNTSYTTANFLNVLLDAVEHTDFTNNTCIRVGGPTGETVFSRLKEADVEIIWAAFCKALEYYLPMIKRLLRNRQVAMAFDTTDEPYYGKCGGLWVHSYCPIRGSTGCFKFITLSCVERENKFILGSLPVQVGEDVVELVEKLIKQAKKYFSPEIFLFDRGFDDKRLVDKLQKLGVRYQILWKKHKWVGNCFKKMKPGEMKEVMRSVSYTYEQSSYKLKIRFVIIKRYRRYNHGKVYDWVFATNTRRKWQHEYVDKYRKRWGIETAFRVLDNVRIKTTTKNPIIRYFINAFCCLVYNSWKLNNLEGAMVSLKNFVVEILLELRNPSSVNVHIPNG